MKKSILDEIAKIEKLVQDDTSKYNSHILMAIESDGHGAPAGKILNVVGKPLEVLGMIEIIMTKLKETKKDLLNHLEDQGTHVLNSNSNIEVMKGRKNVVSSDDYDPQVEDTKSKIRRLIDTMPEPLKSELSKFEKEVEDAVKRNDRPKIEELLKKLNNAGPLDFLRNSMKPDSEPDFDINDFKG